MFKRLNVLRFCVLTRVLMSSANDNTPEATSVNSLEAGIRLLSQSTDHHHHHEPEKLKALLDELIDCNNPRKLHLCREACRLAHTAGHHARCAELFFSCRTLSPIPLNDVVINSAALTTRPEYLQKCLSTLEISSMHPTTSSHAVLSLLLLLRIYWQSTRCYVWVERDRRRSHEEKEMRRDEDDVGSEKSARLAQYRSICEEVFPLLQLPRELSFDSWWSQSKRLVLYHREKDEGEACVYEQHFSCWEHHFGINFCEWLTPTCLVSMIRSCVKGERWDYANRYVDFAEKQFLSGKTVVDDTLLQQSLLVLNASMQNARGSALIRRIRNLCTDYTASVAVVRSVVRVAGDTKDNELAVWCLQTLLSDNQPIPPSSHDIFPCLVALAKCRGANLKKLVRALEESGSIELTREEHLYINLLYNRHSVYWKEELSERIEKYLSDVTTNSVSHSELSVRNITLLLYILQENEYSGFMDYYNVCRRRYQSHDMLAARAQWAAIALKWAISQPTLGCKDYEALVKEGQSLLDDANNSLVGYSSFPPPSQSVKSKLRRRLIVMEELWGKRKNKNIKQKEEKKEKEMVEEDHSADISLARFARQRRCLPRVKAPVLGAVYDASPAPIKLWNVSDGINSLSKQEWSERIWKCS